MRVFIGYGYNARDKWVEDYVVPLVQAFGAEVAHGKAVFGGALPDEILKAIRSSDAMIGFTTRREPAGPEQFSRHEGAPLDSVHRKRRAIGPAQAAAIMDSASRQARCPQWYVRPAFFHFTAARRKETR